MEVMATRGIDGRLGNLDCMPNTTRCCVVHDGAKTVCADWHTRTVRTYPTGRYAVRRMSMNWYCGDYYPPPSCDAPVADDDDVADKDFYCAQQRRAYGMHGWRCCSCARFERAAWTMERQSQCCIVIVRRAAATQRRAPTILLFLRHLSPSTMLEASKAIVALCCMKCLRKRHTVLLHPLSRLASFSFLGRGTGTSRRQRPALMVTLFRRSTRVGARAVAFVCYAVQFLHRQSACQSKLCEVCVGILCLSKGRSFERTEFPFSYGCLIIGTAAPPDAGHRFSFCRCSMANNNKIQRFAQDVGVQGKAGCYWASHRHNDEISRRDKDDDRRKRC
jgi:hypothetical protein